MEPWKAKKWELTVSHLENNEESDTTNRKDQN